MITIPNLKVGIFHQIQGQPASATQKILRMCNFVDKNTTAKIYIIYYQDTVDEKWVKKALEIFDEDKIKYIHYKNLKL
jgi:hypothetical protein